MRDKYYEEELRYLLDAGKQFSKAHPERAKYLNLDNVRARDPHVERLLEAFAFLTGRIRKRLDDDIPEISQSLMSLLWPHFLRPIPALAILEFRPVEGMVESTQTIPRDTEIDSDPVMGGQPCRFRTCSDVRIQPIELAKAGMASNPRGASSIYLSFRVEKGIDLTKLDLSHLRLYLHGDPATAYAIYRLFRREVESVTLLANPDTPQERLIRDGVKIEMGGFGPDEGLVPYPDHSFPGYRLLQEYFCFPEKFLFIDLRNLQELEQAGVVSEFQVECTLKSPPPEGLRLTKDNFRLYCTPIVNLFKRDAEPVRVERLKSEYPIVADFDADENQFETFSVDAAEGVVHNTGERKKYDNFLSFGHESESEDDAGEPRGFFHISRRMSPWGGWDTYISFPDKEGGEAVQGAETVSLELTCTNATMAKELRIGEIRHPTQNMPDFVRFSNITQPTSSVWPPLGHAAEWQFISHLALNFLSLTSIEALQEILRIYDFGRTEANQRRIVGIRGISSSPKELLLHGAPIRGIMVEMELEETHFADEGDLELFSSVLNEFFSLYCSVNSFTQLKVTCAPSGTVLEWPSTIGRQTIL